MKKSALAYVDAYEKAHGKGSVSTFGAHAWDTGVLLQAAIPVALKKAQPGTKEFRAALRDALEGVKNTPGAHGIFNMSASDHLGFDQRAAVMIQIRTEVDSRSSGERWQLRAARVAAPAAGARSVRSRFHVRSQTRS